MYVVEHQIPAREGGIVEYLGSQQSTYNLRGFIVQQETGGSTAALVLSGNAYVAVNADDAKDFLKLLRGSGSQLLLIESTYSMGSGYQTLYENGFFQIEKVTFALEAGRGYPYYPYALDLHGTTPKTYGNSSGAGTVLNIGVGNYYSGYIGAWQLAGPTSGSPQGEVINTIGIYVSTVSSGNLKVAVYSGQTVTSGIITGATLTAQSAPQAVHSGWNYFPIRPSFQTASGASYLLAMAGDATNQSGFVVAKFDGGAINGTGAQAYLSGQSFASAFPAAFNSGVIQTDNHFNIVLVVAN